ALNYTWSNSSNSNSIIVTPLTTTSYSVLGISNSCSNTASFNINVTTTPTLVVSGNFSICTGQSTANIVASGASTYSWLPSSGLSSTTNYSVSANPTTNTNYTLVGSNGVCSTQTIISVQSFSIPVISLSSNSVYICNGQTTAFNISGVASYSVAPSIGIISSSGQTVTVSPPASTNYTFVGLSAQGCSATASQSIEVVQVPVVSVSSATNVICQNTSVSIVATGAQNYNWLPPSGLNSTNSSVVLASPQVNTSYTIVGINGTGSNTCVASSIFNLSVTPQSHAIILPIGSICSGSSIKLTATGGDTYNWSPANSLDNSTSFMPFASPSVTTIYTLVTSYGGICPSTATTQVVVNSSPTISIAPSTSINIGDQAYVYAYTNGTSFNWSAADSSIACSTCQATYVKPMISQYYTFTTINAGGCIASAMTYVEVVFDNQLYIPNAFTPNGDGINDLFFVKGYGISDYTIKIFSRWGNLIYSGSGNILNGITPTWDGKIQGNLCKEDIYNYLIEYRTGDGKSLEKTGSVYLLN
ncbi:MAG: gliding motility-associated C-terminal domain-containing protein, partial [Bacteroidetes bacterium]|nr:gliding motility-associated C-terminal domain-containing protein [Bacteroidota bacterium]